MYACFGMGTEISFTWIYFDFRVYVHLQALQKNNNNNNDYFDKLNKKIK